MNLNDVVLILPFPVVTFRYSGRTQKELVEFVRENYVTPALFQRLFILHILLFIGCLTNVRNVEM